MIFTEKKFLSLPLLQQHKKCAQILRAIYEKILYKEEETSLISHYLQMTKWMHVPSPCSFSQEAISDLYHEHLRASGYDVKEYNLLPPLKSKERLAVEEPLSICIYLDHVRSAYNVGSILRTTEALRLGSVFFSEKTPFIDNEKVMKTSMGSFSYVPTTPNASIENLPPPLDWS